MAQAQTPRGVNHLVLNVRNLEESHRFWTEVIGFKCVAALKPRPGRLKMRFYSGVSAHGDVSHHDLALAQIAASVLEVSIARVSMVSGHTARTPNEGYTGSSMSIETSGIAVLRAAMTARRLLLAEAAKGKGISKAAFDRGHYRYHGRVKALADAAREGGLQF